MDGIASVQQINNARVAFLEQLKQNSQLENKMKIRENNTTVNNSDHFDSTLGLYENLANCSADNEPQDFK